MAGLLGRKAAIAGWAFLAATGNRYSEGRLQFFKTLEMLYRDWSRYRGASGKAPTLRNLYAFLRTQYGMELDEPEDGGPLTAEKVDEIFRLVAGELLSRGLIEVQSRGRAG
jgi:hypothetical protein